MNDLFPITPSTDLLTSARRRLEEAERAYAEALRIDEECDGFGETMYTDLKRAMTNAALELHAAERERMGR